MVQVDEPKLEQAVVGVICANQFAQLARVNQIDAQEDGEKVSDRRRQNQTTDSVRDIQASLVQIESASFDI